MNNDEKIRLVLETLGVENVKQATKALREMQQGLEAVNTASTAAAGKSGMSGNGVLQLAFFLDDLQYGLKGVINNIPILVQSLGLGTGLAGAISIAAIGISQLITKFEHWFDTNEKVKESLAELTDSIIADESAIKRYREEVEKLGKTNSQRVEDILKLKSATEDLQVAESRLAEDRKNQKAVEDAANNRSAEEVDQLNQRKEVVKSVVSDAGNERAMLNAIGAGLDAATPGAGITEADRQAAMSQVASDAGSNLKNLTPSEIQKRANAKLAELKRKKDLDRQNTIAESQRTIFGGITNPKTLEEFNSNLERLGQYAPDFAGQITGVIQGDAADVEFQQGLSSRSAAIRRRNERQAKASAEMASNPQIPSSILAQRQAEIAALAAGERSGAAMLPNAAMFEADQNQKTLRDRAAQEAAAANAAARNAAIRNEVMGLYDPTTLAAMRYRQAPQNARARNAMQARDTQGYAQEFMARGMSENEAMEAAQQSISGGNRSLQDYAAQIDKTLANGVRAFEVAGSFLQQQQARLAEMEARQSMMVDQLNQMSNSQTRVRPQQFRARQ